MANSTEKITLSRSQLEGAQAAAQMFAAGELKPEHATNPGADSWGEPGCNLGDAAYAAWHDSSHYQSTGSDWDDYHWEAYLLAFETVGDLCLKEQRLLNT